MRKSAIRAKDFQSFVKLFRRADKSRRENVTTRRRRRRLVHPAARGRATCRGKSAPV